MTASLLPSVLRRSLSPALLASCFLVAGAGCGDDSDWNDASPSEGSDRDGCRRRRRAPPDELATCAGESQAVFVIDAPGAFRADTDVSTLWARACFDDNCVDAPLATGAEGRALSLSVPLAGLACEAGPSVAAVSVYDAADGGRAPLFSEVREVVLGCGRSRAECVATAVEVSVPDEAFSCSRGGALISLRSFDAIPLPAGAAPTAIVCVDGACSDVVFLPTTSSGIEGGVSLDVFVPNIERSESEATTHVVELVVGTGSKGSPLFRKTFELVLEPAAEVTCDVARQPDFVLPLQPGMFAAVGGTRPPPYEPGEGGAGGAGGEGGAGGAAGEGGAAGGAP